VEEKCRPGERCINGHCVQCETDNDCGPGTVCNTATGTCVSGTSCESDADCARFPGRRCALATRQCTVPQCTLDSQCTSSDRRMRCNMDTFQCYMPPAVCVETDEPNDTPGDATPLTPNTTGGGSHGTSILCRGGIDYLSFPVEAGKRVDVLVTMTPGSSGEAYGVALALYGPEGGDAVASATFSYSGATRRLGANVAVSGTALLRLVGNGTQENQWTYTVDVTLTEPLLCETEAGEPNNSLAQAQNSVIATQPFTRALCSSTDEDYHLYHAGAAKRVAFTIDYEDDRSLDVDLLSVTGTSLDAPWSSSSPIVAQTTTPAGAADLVIRVRQYSYYDPSDDPLIYTITVTEEDLPTCSDQAYEPNNTRETATPITPGTVSAVACDGNDDDWFSFTLAQQSPVRLTLTFPQGMDMDMRLYSATSMVNSAAGGANPEVINETTVAAGTYWVHVDPYSDGTTYYPAPYTLALVAPGFCTDDVLDNAPGNDTVATATGLRDSVDGTLNYVEDLRICRGDEDWFRLVALGHERITAVVTGLSSSVVTVYASTGTGPVEKGRSRNVTLATDQAAEYVSVPVDVAAGLFYVKVAGGTNTEGNYRLNLSTETDVCEGLGGDREWNDTPANSITAPTGPAEGIVCPANDVDVYKLQASSGATLAATVTFDGTKGDLDLELWQPGQAEPVAVDADADTTAGSTAAVSFTVAAGGNYYVVVRRKGTGELGQRYTILVTGQTQPSSSSSGPASSSAAQSSSAGASSASSGPAVSSGVAPSSGEVVASSGEGTSSSGEETSSSGEETSSSGEETSSSGEETSSSGEGTSSSGEAVSSSSSGETSSSSGGGQVEAEVCTGGDDEDEDALVDCVDQDCFTDAACVTGVDCAGTLPDERPGCAADECIFSLSCGLGEDCAQPGDEDGDGVSECDDPECRGIAGSPCP
jgi:hypothetical protein